MASNCVVKKFNGDTQNDSLLLLGAIVVNIVQNALSPDDRFLEASVGATCKVVSGSCYFTDETGTQNLGTEITLSNSPLCYVSNNTGKIAITSKYNVSNLRCERVGYVNADSLSYMGAESGAQNLRIYLDNDTESFGDITGLGKANIPFRELIMPSEKVSGDVSEIVFEGPGYLILYSPMVRGTLNVKSGITCNGIYLSGSKVEGTTVQLGTINATKIYTGDHISGNVVDIANGNLDCYDLHAGSKITGTIESLFEAWIANGKTTPEGVVVSPVLTFNNVEPVDMNAQIKRFEYNNGVLTIKDVGYNVLGAYNGSSWTYS